MPPRYSTQSPYLQEMYDPADRASDRIGASIVPLSVLAFASLGAFVVTVVLAFCFYPWSRGLIVSAGAAGLLLALLGVISYLAKRVARHNIALAPGLSGDELQEGFRAFFLFCRTSADTPDGSIRFVAYEYRWLRTYHWDKTRSGRAKERTGFDLKTDPSVLEAAWRDFLDEISTENGSRLDVINQTKVLSKSLKAIAKNLPSAEVGEEVADPPPPEDRSRSSLLAQ